MRPIVIVGAGGFGREVHELIEAINLNVWTYDVKGFVDANPALHGTTVHGIPVLGAIEVLSTFDGPTEVVLAIGSPENRVRLAKRLEGYEFPVLIHPHTQISSRARVGKGCIIRAGASIQTNAVVGDFCSISNYSVIGHDAIIGPYCSIAPNVCIVGEGVLGEGANIGAGAVVVAPASVGEWAVVGANAVVTKDIPANSTAVGVPARVIKRREPGWHLQA